MVEKPSVSAFQNFLRIENPLDIKEVMSKNISDNNSAALLLMSHVGDVGDVKYLNKRSKATLYRGRAMLLMSEMSEISQYYEITVLRYFTNLRITLCIIIQTIQIKKYFELILWITWNFELNPCINSN